MNKMKLGLGFAGLLVAIAAFLLYGCQKEPAPNRPAGSAASTQEAALGSNPKARVTGLYPLQGVGGWVYGAGGDDGYYSISPFVQADGSTNIQYTDYETMQTVPLCSQVNCTHNTEACTSWLPYNGGGTSLMIVGNELLLVAPGAPGAYDELKERSLPQIRACQLNGSERRKIVEFSANQQLRAPYITDGKKLYGTLETSTEEETILELIKIDLLKGSYTTVTLLDSSKAACVWGAAGEYIVLNELAVSGEQAMTQRDYGVRVLRLNVNTLEKELLLEYNVNEGRVALFGKNILYYDHKTNRMSLIDSLTKESRTIAENFLEQGIALYDLNLIFYDEPNLLTSMIVPNTTSNQVQRKFQILNADDESEHDTELYYLQDDRSLPIVPIATIGKENSYFVICDETSVQSQGTADEGSKYYISSPAPQYAKITKENYWQGIKEMVLAE